MRERTDFSLRGDYVSEVEEWKFIPTPSCKTKARAPFPASYIRPSHEYLEHDYRVTILKQDAEESTDQEDDIVHEVFGGDDGFLPPAVTSLVYADDGWPMHLQRIPFSESLSLQQVRPSHAFPAPLGNILADAFRYFRKGPRAQIHALVSTLR